MLNEIFEEFLDSLNKYYTNTELALIAGVNKSTISNFRNMNPGKQKEINFYSYLKIIKELAPSREVEEMKKASIHFQKPENIRCVFEYYSMHRLLPQLSKYIEKHKNHNNIGLKETAALYEVFLVYQTNDGSYTSNQIREMNHKLNLILIENKILSLFIDTYLAHRDKMFISELNNLSIIRTKLDHYCECSPKEFFKATIETRLYELYCNVHLHATLDFDKVRNYANKIISANLSPRFSSSAYYFIGASFLDEDFTKYKQNIMKSIEILRSINREDLAKKFENNNLNFARIFWGEELDKVVINDDSDTMHYEAKWGDKDKALKLISTKNDDELSPFQLYYKGIATSDIKYLSMAVAKFLSKGDKFYANTLIKLLPDGISEQTKCCLQTIIDSYQLKIGG